MRPEAESGSILINMQPIPVNASGGGSAKYAARILLAHESGNPEG